MNQPPGLQTDLLRCSRSTRQYVLDLATSNAALLEACEAALPYIEQACSESDYINDDEDQGFAVMRLLKSVIARAKGES